MTPAGLLRVVLRAAAVAVWTIVIVLTALPGLVTLLFGRAIFGKSAGYVVHLWGKGLLPILGVKLVVEGPRPAPGSFVLSNHLSHLDILVLAALYPNNFIAKSEISSWPVVGFLARLGATIWVDRELARDTVRLRELLHYLLSHRVTITMFAEGTSGNGAEILPFKPSLMESAARLQVPCTPVAISYRTPGAGPGPAGPDGGDPARTVCWWGEMSFVPHYLKMMQLRRIVATVRFGEPVTGIDDRKALAREARERVAAMFDPIPQ